MAGAAKPDARPLSPHIQVWRWHVTMAASILHRATGVGLYLAALFLVVWVVLLAAGPDAYAFADSVLNSWFGQIKLYGIVAVLAYHLANGVRHLIWDTGRHLDPKAASGSAWLTFAFAIAAPAALYAYLNYGV